jgi:hypothetical protein
MSIPVGGTIIADGAFAAIDPQQGIDGWRSVATHAARNAIITLQRRVGMIVVSQSDTLGIAWQLNTATNTGTDADWTQFPAFADLAGTATAAQLPTTGLTITQHAAAIGTAVVSGGATTLDATAHDKWIVTLVNGTSTTITISGIVAGQTLSVSLLQDATGSCLATYSLSSGTLKWAAGSAPTLTTGAAKGDKLVFDCVSTGIVWGMIAGQNF